MSLDLFRVIKGIDVQADDISLSSQILNGNGIPGLTTETNEATVGSVYMQTDAESDKLNLYWKHTAGTGADKWARAASKSYVDAAVSGISWREPVRALDTTTYANLAAAEAALNDTGTPAVLGGIDADQFADGDRIVFTNLTTGTENVYIVTGTPGSGATLTEDPANTLTNGDAVLVLEGDEADTQWVFDGDTTNEWVKFGGASSNTELENIRDFIGKDAAGVEGPDYPSNALVIDGNSLENEIGRLDHATGNLQFTNDYVVTDYSDNLGGAATGTITDNLDAIDAAFGDGTIAPAGGNYALDANMIWNGGTETVTSALDALNEGIGDRDYSEQNLITNGQSASDSLDALDQAIGDLDNTSAYTVTAGAGGFLTVTELAGNSVQETLDEFNNVIGDLLDDTDEGTGTNISTPTVIDTISATEATEVRWMLQVKENGGTARRAMEIHALTDGTNVDWTRYSVLRLGNTGNVGVSVDINGGNIELSIDPANALDYTVKRISKSFL